MGEHCQTAYQVTVLVLFCPWLLVFSHVDGVDVTTGTMIVIISVEISGAKDTNETWFTPPEVQLWAWPKAFPLGIEEFALQSPPRAFH